MSHVKRLEIGGVCLNGHELTGDTIYWREKRGSKYIACLPCKRDRAKRSYEKNKLVRVRNREAEYRARGMSQNDARLLKRIIADEAEGDMAHKNDERPSAPWNYLRPKPEAQEKLEALNAAIDELDERTRCYASPQDYMDYEEENSPTVVEAALMCDGCPVLDLCRDYAVASKDRGVWGGIRVTDGKKLIGLEVK